MMTQPLMLTPPAVVPPAQAEALYDAALHRIAEQTDNGERYAPAEPSAWPGEDWDDPAPLPSPLPRPPSRVVR